MENRDEKLWQLAGKRAAFKGKIVSYVAVTIFLWAVWYFNGQHTTDNGIPWPAWVSLGWGFGLVIGYIKLYHMNTTDQIEKEYEKLKNRS
jgi:hypothetical protein